MLTSPVLPVDTDLQLTVLVEGRADFKRARRPFGQRRTKWRYLLLFQLEHRLCWEKKGRVFARPWLCSTLRHGNGNTQLADRIHSLRLNCAASPGSSIPSRATRAYVCTPALICAFQTCRSSGWAPVRCQQTSAMTGCKLIFLVILFV